MSENPFLNRAKKEFPLLPAGYYHATLTEIKGKKGKDRDGKEVDKVQFTFEAEAAGTHRKVFSSCYCGTKENSRFVMTIRAIDPAAFNPAVLEDPVALWDYAQSLIGHQVQIYVTIKDKWNNIDTIVPVIESQAAVVQPVQSAPVQTTLANDEVPF